MAKFSDLMEILERLSNTFPHSNSPIDDDSIVTVIASDDEVDELSKLARRVAMVHWRQEDHPEAQEEPRHLVIKKFRWIRTRLQVRGPIASKKSQGKSKSRGKQPDAPRGR